MNKTQVNNFLWCLSHIKDPSYLVLHARVSDISSANTKEDGYTHDHDDDSHALLVAKIVAMVVLFCATLLCGSIPFLLDRCLHWTANNTNARSSTVVKCLLYFGGGVLLCTTFLHLLPEVQETIDALQECGTLPQLPFPLAEMLMCAGFFLMYLVEELIHAYIHRHKRMVDKDPASAAFDRGHRVRNSYLVNGGKEQQQQQLAATERIDSAANNDMSNDLEQEHCQNAPTSAKELSQQYTGHHDHQENHYHHHYHHNHFHSDHKHHGHQHHDHQQHVPNHSHAHGHTHLQVGNEHDDIVTSSLRGLLIVLALSLHELFEGMAIGLESSAGSVWFMFSAVSAHKLVLAFCVGVELIVARTRPVLAFVYVLTFAVVSPLGIGIGVLISHNDTSSTASIPSGIVQGLACGTLLYVVFFEILSSNRSGLLAYISLIAGFVMMFWLQWLASDGHGHSHGGCSSINNTAKSLLTGSHLKQHGSHDQHNGQSHIPRTTTVMGGETNSFEQQLQILH